MKVIAQLWICLILAILFSPYTNASYSTIRLAIFDNPKIDRTNLVSSQNLQNSYMAGVSTAVLVAQSKGIHIETQSFFYGDSLLNIIQEVPNVKNWNPDVIMGLHSSNESLMSRTFFTDQLVLSISATDVQLAELPANFYSLGTPDPHAVKAYVKFIDKYYPKSNLFLIVGAESKESADLANLIADAYKKKHPQQVVSQSKFLSDDINNLDVASLMQGYKPGDVIVLFAIDYYSLIDAMNKIADYLKPQKPIFITSADNWGNTMTPGEQKNPFDAFRIDTLFVDTDSEEYKVFAKNYNKIYHQSPKDRISFITYQAVMSLGLSQMWGHFV